MRIRQQGVFAAVLMALAALTGCEKESTSPDESLLQLHYVGFSNYGCGGILRPARSQYNDPYLDRHVIEDDRLTLTIVYSANCCPAFVDSVRILDRTVGIQISDTLRGCRCVCGYENDFEFEYSGSGRLRILFGWLTQPFSLDTTIVLP